MKNKILKYKVPKCYQHKFNDNKIIYCEIVETQKLNVLGKTVYKVNMINFKNYPNMFLDYELKKLNILDKIKLKLRRNKTI